MNISVQVGRDILDEEFKVENKIDLILLLLKEGSITGITRLVKLLFLMQREGKFDKLLKNEDGFEYEAYKFGPFSSEVYDLINALENMGLIRATSSQSRVIQDELEERETVKEDLMDIEVYENRDTVGSEFDDSEANKKFEVTEKGNKIANALYASLDDEKKQYLKKMWKTYAQWTLYHLLRYVYKNYPGQTRKSEIKEKVLD